jgi:hypothetical protein
MYPSIRLISAEYSAVSLLPDFGEDLRSQRTAKFLVPLKAYFSLVSDGFAIVVQTLAKNSGAVSLFAPP